MAKLKIIARGYAAPWWPIGKEFDIIEIGIDNEHGLRLVLYDEYGIAKPSRCYIRENNKVYDFYNRPYMEVIN